VVLIVSESDAVIRRETVAPAEISKQDVETVIVNYLAKLSHIKRNARHLMAALW
jgi:hypothetical protein